MVNMQNATFAHVEIFKALGFELEPGALGAGYRAGTVLASRPKRQHGSGHGLGACRERFASSASPRMQCVAGRTSNHSPLDVNRK
jgi:hypothetical protein